MNTLPDVIVQRLSVYFYIIIAALVFVLVGIFVVYKKVQEAEQQHYQIMNKLHEFEKNRAD